MEESTNTTTEKTDNSVYAFFLFFITLVLILSYLFLRIQFLESDLKLEAFDRNLKVDSLGRNIDLKLNDLEYKLEKSQNNYYHYFSGYKQIEIKTIKLTK